jgi:hypothetical protein
MKFLLFSMGCVLSALLPSARGAAQPDSYVFTYFTKNGEDGLHLTWSPDGYRWEALHAGESYLAPTVGRSKLMRDPCVVRGPDGIFRMVWTSGWTENDIGYASSRDLIHWSEQREIPVMAHEAKVSNSWAPEVHYDPQRNEFIIFWSSTIPGRFPATDGSSERGLDHRIYFTTTKDFVRFAPTRLFYDPGFSVIDATFLHANGRHYLIVKNETLVPTPKKYLQIAASTDIRGPFSPLSAPFTPPGLWVEGPTAIKIGSDYLVYFDAYKAKHYGAMRSRDLKKWEDVSGRMSFPFEGTPVRMRHGTVIAVPAAIAAGLRGTAAP